MTDIFALEAPKYWAHGIPVMPLRPMSKRPFLNQWQHLCHQMPTEQQQASWLIDHRSNNIGLPLGPMSGIMIVDVDTTDPKVVEAIMKVLPKSPWHRVGAKGSAMAFKFNNQRPFKIQSANEGMLVEVLATGNQVVLPPSIHPDTQQPYVANCNLYDVLDDLVPLPVNMEEILRGALQGVVELKSNKTHGFKGMQFVAAGARDTMMTQNAGLLAYSIGRGECTFREALGHMSSWAANLVQRVNGDEVDVAKGQRKIAEFLMADVTTRGKILPPNWDADLTPEEKLMWGLDITEDQEEWTCNQITDYILGQFSDSTAGDSKRMETVQYVLRKISRSTKLDELEIGRILTMMKNESGLDLPISFYNKELKRLQRPALEGANHTEIANEVVKMYEEREDDLRFYNSKFWRWNGLHWEEVSEQTLRSLIATEFGSMLAAKKSHDHKGIIDILKNILPQELTAYQVPGVNMLNGFLTNELRLVPHAKEQGMTYVLPMSYKPEEADRMPRFMTYLHDSWGHEPDYEERVQLLREMLAVTLFGMAPSYQKAFLLYGVGGSGKSVLLEIIGQLVPKEAQCALPPTLWAEKHTNAELSGKLLNLAGELPDKVRISGEYFKNIVTGEPIQVQEKFQKPFAMRCKAAHWFASNYLPSSADGSAGFNRRWTILVFDKIIPIEHRIPDLGKIIVEEEVEGIIAWAVQALPDLIARSHYTPCESSDQYVGLMAMRNSPIRMWMSENIEENPGQGMFLDALYRDFFNFSSMHGGGRQLSMGDFRTLLEQFLKEEGKFVIEKRAKGDVFMNFTLKKK